MFQFKRVELPRISLRHHKGSALPASGIHNSLQDGAPLSEMPVVCLHKIEYGRGRFCLPARASDRWMKWIRGGYLRIPYLRVRTRCARCDIYVVLLPL
jgi:hypothetical protein